MLVSTVVFVINMHENILRLRESQRVLHWVLQDPYLQNAQLMIVFNKPKGHELYALKKEQLIKLLKLDPADEGTRKEIGKFFGKEMPNRLKEFDVDDEAKCKLFFNELADLAN